MRILALLACFLGLGASSQAGWVAEENGRIDYSQNPAQGHATFDAALKKLSDSGLIAKLDVIGAHELLREDALQDEIFAALERDAPRQLAEALKSSGNMHNPKMIQLWDPFRKALLASPTITRLDASLARYGLVVSRVGFEKFELRSTLTDPRRRFHGSLWLNVSMLPRPGAGESDIRPNLSNTPVEKLIDDLAPTCG